MFGSVPNNDTFYLKVPFKTHKVALQCKVVKGQQLSMPHGDSRLRGVRIKHNKESAVHIRTFKGDILCSFLLLGMSFLDVYMEC